MTIGIMMVSIKLGRMNAAKGIAILTAILLAPIDPSIRTQQLQRGLPAVTADCRSEQNPGGWTGNDLWFAILTRHDAMDVAMPRPSAADHRERVLLACEQSEGHRAAIARRR